jgi:hypothetical protein
MTRIGGLRLAAAVTAATALTGCQEVVSYVEGPKPPSPQVVADLAKAQADGAVLFAALKQPAKPGCTADANAGGFLQVQTDLDQAAQDNRAAPSIATATGIDKAKTALTDLRTKSLAGGQCLPAPLIADVETHFDSALRSINH